MISGPSPGTFRYFEVILLEAKLCCCMFLEAAERGISNIGNPDEPQRARTKVKFMLLKNGSITCIDIIAENFTQANSSSSEPGRKLFFSHEILATPDHISCVTLCHHRTTMLRPKFLPIELGHRTTCKFFAAPKFLGRPRASPAAAAQVRKSTAQRSRRKTCLLSMETNMLKFNINGVAINLHNS